jgi:site-specific DNA-methyltransferase (adenine-specific)
MCKDTGKSFFQYKKSLLINGVSLDKNTFDKEVFDLIITSPPYNVDIKYNSHQDDLTYEEYLNFSEKWISNCFFFFWTRSQGRFCLNILLNKNKSGKKSVG